jgi:hypothetical protein
VIYDDPFLGRCDTISILEKDYICRCTYLKIYISCSEQLKLKHEPCIYNEHFKK